MGRCRYAESNLGGCHSGRWRYNLWAANHECMHLVRLLVIDKHLLVHFSMKTLLNQCVPEPTNENRKKGASKNDLPHGGWLTIGRRIPRCIDFVTGTECGSLLDSNSEKYERLRAIPRHRWYLVQVKMAKDKVQKKLLCRLSTCLKSSVYTATNDTSSKNGPAPSLLLTSRISNRLSPPVPVTITLC